MISFEQPGALNYSSGALQAYLEAVKLAQQARLSGGGGGGGVVNMPRGGWGVGPAGGGSGGGSQGGGGGGGGGRDPVQDYIDKMGVDAAFAEKERQRKIDWLAANTMSGNDQAASEVGSGEAPQVAPGSMGEEEQPGQGSGEASSNEAANLPSQGGGIGQSADRLRAMTTPEATSATSAGADFGEEDAGNVEAALTPEQQAAGAQEAQARQQAMQAQQAQQQFAQRQAQQAQQMQNMPLTQSDRTQMALLQAGLSTVNQRANNGIYTPQEAADMRTQIMTGLNPLRMREERARAQAAEQANQTRMHTEAQLTTIRNANAAQTTAMVDRLTHTYPDGSRLFINPVTGHEHFTPAPKQEHDPNAITPAHRITISNHATGDMNREIAAARLDGNKPEWMTNDDAKRREHERRVRDAIRVAQGNTGGGDQPAAAQPRAPDPAAQQRLEQIFGNISMPPTASRPQAPPQAPGRSLEQQYTLPPGMRNYDFGSQ